jgi:tripeptide aminopeptidase
MSRLLPIALVALTALAAAQTPSPDAAVKAVVDSPRFKAAMAALDKDHDRLVAEIIQLTEIPAPPFKEAARAKAYLAMLKAHGLTNVEQDAEGNVMGIRRGTGQGPILAIAAHLDTVFPEGTDVRVKRNGTRLAAPGIGDDTRSLAVLLALVRAMDAAGIQTQSDILFVGDVGEEGLGDLRGVKHLFNKGPYRGRIGMFISMDGSGSGADITHAGVGSRRYRATFKGPGGHSYGAFGLVSPAFAMGNAMDNLGRMPVPASPKTTFNVGVIGGGTSVNSIPFESWMEIDLRSESAAELEKLNETMMGLLNQAVAEENKARSTRQGAITLDLKLVGDRPTGQTPRESRIVQTAAAAVRAAGLTPAFGISSTDSNVPFSLGIPAITIDSGGDGGRAHALDEWIDVEKSASLRGMQIALAILLALAGQDQGR